MCSNRGSSPLARGLLLPLRRRARRIRIIPARAGFTTDEALALGEIEDHPRSRGVYGDDRGETGEGAGSSPLARGLRVAVEIVPALRGIIPARAGFTQHRPGTVRGGGDHPRSRGVYRAPVTRLGGRGGSSPLARGLLRHRQPLSVVVRIIPARAGFTLAHAGPGPPEPDHPRSRGVYDLPKDAEVPVDGSSPLARGLRSAEGCRGPGGRIIPARAGFTSDAGRFE